LTNNNYNFLPRTFGGAEFDEETGLATPEERPLPAVSKAEGTPDNADNSPEILF